MAPFHKDYADAAQKALDTLTAVFERLGLEQYNPALAELRTAVSEMLTRLQTQGEKLSQNRKLADSIWALLTTANTPSDDIKNDYPVRFGNLYDSLKTLWEKFKNCELDSTQELLKQAIEDRLKLEDEKQALTRERDSLRTRLGEVTRYQNELQAKFETQTNCAQRYADRLSQEQTKSAHLETDLEEVRQLVEDLKAGNAEITSKINQLIYEHTQLIEIKFGLLADNQHLKDSLKDQNELERRIDHLANQLKNFAYVAPLVARLKQKMSIAESNTKLCFDYIHELEQLTKDQPSDKFYSSRENPSYDWSHNLTSLSAPLNPAKKEVDVPQQPSELKPNVSSPDFEEVSIARDIYEELMSSLEENPDAKLTPEAVREHVLQETGVLKPKINLTEDELPEDFNEEDYRAELCSVCESGWLVDRNAPFPYTCPKCEEKASD